MSTFKDLVAGKSCLTVILQKHEIQCNNVAKNDYHQQINPFIVRCIPITIIRWGQALEKKRKIKANNEETEIIKALMRNY